MSIKALELTQKKAIKEKLLTIVGRLRLKRESGVSVLEGFKGPLLLILSDMRKFKDSVVKGNIDTGSQKPCCQ